MNEHFAPRLRESRVELARQPDFDLGSAVVRPSVCEVAFGDGSERLEPRVMQVLVALARAEGEVLSREELIASCWQGRIVGEDAINRCIARLRRLFESRGPDVTVTTVPRVGFRLDVAVERSARAGRLSRRRRALALAAAGLLVLAGSAAAWAWGRPSNWLVAGYRPFAAETLIERHPAFSPDGRSLAFAAGADVENRRIYVRALKGGESRQLSQGPGDDYAPAFSPAGDRIAFVRYVPGKPCEILLRPLQGGPESVAGRCRNDSRTRLAWSQDGREIYFSDSPAADAAPAILALDLSTGRARQLTHPDPAAGEKDVEQVLSPDGRRLAFLRERVSGTAELMVLDLGRGLPKAVPTPGVRPGGFAWTPDGRSLLVASDRAGDFSLWSVRVAGSGAPRRMLTALRALGRVVTTPAGVLAIETDTARISISRLGGGDIAPANSSDWSPDIAPDGSLAFLSDRGGGKGLWLARPGHAPVQLVDTPFDHLYGVRWSSGGRRIAFVGAREGSVGLYVVGSDGFGLTRLSITGLDFGAPAWTADGRGLIAPVRDARGWRLMRAPTDPDRPVEAVTGYGWVSVRTSYDGLFGVRADAPGIWRIRPGKAPSLAAPHVTAAKPEDWAVWSGQLYTLHRTARGEADVYATPVSGGAPRKIGHVSRLSEEPGLTVDPKTGAPVFPRIVFEDSDIGLMNLTRGR